MKKGVEKKAYIVINWIKKHLLAILIVIFSCVIVLDVANYALNPIAGNASSFGMPSGSAGDMSDFSGQEMPGSTSESDSDSSNSSGDSADSDAVDNSENLNESGTAKNSETSDSDTTDMAANSNDTASLGDSTASDGAASSEDAAASEGTGSSEDSSGTDGVTTDESASGTDVASADENSNDSSEDSDTATDSSTSGDTQSGEMPSGNMPSGEMPSGDMPSGEMPSGEMPSGEMPDGATMPGNASSDSSSSDSTDSASTGSTSSDTDATASFPQTTDANTSTGNLFFNALILLRRAWLPVLIIFSAADAVVIVLFARKKRKESRERKAAEEKARKEALLADIVPEEEILQPEKRRRGFWVAPCCLFIAIAVVVAMLPSGSTANSMTVNEEVVESTAEKNTISTVLSGTGTLTDSDAVEVTVPDSVDVTSYLVSNGDTVAVGDALATVDTTSVEAAIVELQEVIDELDADLIEEGEKSAESTVTATAAGKVKYIYAEAGTSVADTVYTNGALVLLSLDGLMAVDIETTAVSVGDSVTVTLSDGSTEKGTVASISEGKATVTLSDDAAYQDSVSVSASDGTVLGSGTLSINSELKVMGYNGTVKSLSVSVGDEVDAGDTLMTLTDVGHTATYQAMLTRRSELESQMEELFKLTQDGTVYAQTAGIVSGVSDDLLATSADASESVSLLQTSNKSGNSDSAVLQELSATDCSDVSYIKLANEPDSSAYSQTSSLMNYCATVSSVSDNQLTLKVSSVVYSNLDYADLSELSFTNLKNDLTLTYTDQIWLYQNGWSKSMSVSNLKTGDKLVLTYPAGSTDANDIIWIVYAGSTDSSQSGNSGNSGNSDGSGQNSGSAGNSGNTGNSGSAGSADVSGNSGNTGSSDSTGNAGGSGASGITGNSGDTGVSGDGSDTGSLSGNGQISGDSDFTELDENALSALNGLQGNVTDAASGEDALNSQLETQQSLLSGTDTQSTTTEETAVYEQYSISEKTVCAVTPQEQMTLTISVDELDIMSLSDGLEAEITLDAISGQSFTGSVTQISQVGTNEGGNTKYNVVVTLDRTEDMLAGMNGSVKITTATSDSVTTVPAEALVEQDGKTYVYTSYDKGSDTLGGLTEVETGVSDGDLVEIVSGLEEGDSCYYKYAETVTYNFLAGK